MSPSVSSLGDLIQALCASTRVAVDTDIGIDIDTSDWLIDLGIQSSSSSLHSICVALLAHLQQAGSGDGRFDVGLVVGNDISLVVC